MENKAKYNKWIPVDGDLKRLSCEGLHDDYEGFRILLKTDDETSSILRINFENALAYMNVDEGDRLKTLSSSSSFDGHSLFTVESSEWISWFIKESHGIHDASNIKHYAIYTVDDCIDVLSEYEPLVKWLD